MASNAPSRQSAAIPFWRDSRIIAIILQIVFLVVVLSGLAFLFNNMITGLRQSNLLPSFSFLPQSAGFPISEGLPYDPSRSYGYAFVVGIWNTIRVSFIGIVLATILGVILGISRLSSNWMLRNVASTYIEIVRNIPLLLQLIFWFTMTRAFPSVQQSIDVGELVFLNNRSVALAWPRGGETFGTWELWLYAGLIVGVVFYIVRRVQFARRDVPGVALPWAMLLAGGVALIGFVVSFLTAGQAPLYLDIPQLNRFNFSGGVTVSASFAALLTGLTLYTAAFIAEIVRSGIIAVSKGQREASRSLGLTASQTMQLVIFPQALRIMIPPTTSQYLNLTKNSSLAIAVAYPDLFTVGGIILNQTGQTVTVIVMIMAIYLTISLVTSLIMNWYNSRIQLVER